MTDDDPLIGSLVGDRYRVSALIGRGGMASVYRASDETLPREVALKVMAGSQADHELLRQRSEIETFAALSHHALVTLYDAGTETTDAGERTFLVMEFVDGPNLRDALVDGLERTAIARIGADVAEALLYVHGRGVVHRDVKPANILLAPDGLPGRVRHAKLADFGIARLVGSSHLTTTGIVLGTASYLSPEQARGNQAGPAADVYALGIVLLEALTGTPPFPGTAVESASARVMRAPLVPSSLGDEWCRLLTAMTALDPHDRIDAAEVAMRCARIADTGSLSIPLPSTTETVAMERPADGDRTLPLPTAVSDEGGATPETAGAAAGAAATAGPGASASDPARTASAGPSGNATRSRWRRGWRVGVGGAVLVVSAALGAAAWAANPPPTPASHSPSTTYPPVGGTLGTHLKQLQKSVTP
ncbi:serine/threonine-protein kinase [Microbacterium sp. STN6]|uniref:serine/threonine-protein kinase n=1 Tax=Microbacterium sp. STN6 TaxID=2995588 RepID=UPI002260ECE4|nr:serine/threonine-protein kinase [Microbacterium sp. STN6]MCX7521208.1 serine/threonine-protein kinase [Microbacterium sp. STN6]